jgi:hypothetical protein
MTSPIHLWGGMIPTEISITDSEISSDIKPTPYYVSDSDKTLGGDA